MVTNEESYIAWTLLSGTVRTVIEEDKVSFIGLYHIIEVNKSIARRVKGSRFTLNSLSLRLCWIRRMYFPPVIKS